VTGVSAAGKSTVADVLARRFERGVHVRGDTFRKMVVAGRENMRPGAPPEARHQLELRYELAVAAANRYAGAGFTVVLQDVILRRTGEARVPDDLWSVQAARSPGLEDDAIVVGRYGADHLDGVLALCRQEGWPSFPEDPARAHRALTAPGVTTVVATAGGRVV